MPPPGKRGKYLGFVAHELKNPLATALWSSDLLKRMDAADRVGERAEKMIDVSLRALRRMRRLIDDFFTIERLLEHGYELKRERMSLKDLVEPAMRALAEKDGIATDGWLMELGDVSTVGDADMLRRAEAPPHPIFPPDPEERPSGDPAGAVLGIALASRILAAHDGRLEERE